MAHTGLHSPRIGWWEFHSVCSEPCSSRVGNCRDARSATVVRETKRTKKSTPQCPYNPDSRTCRAWCARAQHSVSCSSKGRENTPTHTVHVRFVSEVSKCEKKMHNHTFSNSSLIGRTNALVTYSAASLPVMIARCIEHMTSISMFIQVNILIHLPMVVVKTESTTQIFSTFKIKRLKHSSCVSKCRESHIHT